MRYTDYNLVALNEKLKQMQNLPPELFAIGTPIEDWYRYIAERGEYRPDKVFDFDSMEEAVSLRMESIKRGEAFHYERELPDGRTIEIRRNPIANGGFVSTLSDISERKKAEQEISDQRAMLEAVLENMDQGVIMYDGDLTVRLFNAQAGKIWGYPDDVLKEGATSEELISYFVERGDMGTQDVTERADEAKGRVRTKESSVLERELFDGTVVEIRRRPLPGGGLVATHTDITERKKAEQEIATQRAVLEAVLENFDQGVSMFDESLTLVACNDRFNDILQLPAERFTIGTGMAEMFRYNAERGEYGDGDIEQQVQDRVDLASKFEAHQFERDRGDGMILEVRGIPIPNGGFVSTYTDITERKRAENILKESEQRLREIFDNSPIGAGISIDDGGERDGIIQFVNPKFAEIIGLDEGDLGTAKSTVFMPEGEVREQTMATLERGKVVQDLETILYRHDGSEFWALLSIVPTEYEGHKSALFWIYDITERKLAEQEIKEQNENMALLNRVTAAANEAGSADEALAGCLREICLTLDWPVGHAYLHNAGGDPPLLPSKVWHVDAAVDITAFRDMTEATTCNLGQGLPGRVLESNAPAWIVDVTKDANFPRAAAAEAIGAKAGFAFPASIGDDVVAVMEFFSRESFEPDQRMLDTLGTVGQQLGGAILRKIAEQQLADAFAVISSSIEYASNIQLAALPSTELLSLAFEDHFVIWEPRDVVGGDIYWCLPIEGGYVLAVADCTGHGVPGAFITLVASGALRFALTRQPDAEPAALVADMNRFIKEVLAQYTDDSTSDDGLELGVCRISAAGEIDFAGARFSLWQAANGEFREIKGDKTGIGYCHVPLNLKLNSHHIDVGEDSRFYLISDGFNDQVGGEKRRALGKKRLLNVLQDNVGEPMDRQRTAVMEMFTAYQGDELRRDDLTMFGFRL